MEGVDLLPFIGDELAKLGFPGVVIALLTLAVAGLWRAFRYERLRNSELTDKALAMAEEAQRMIERIAGS